MEKSVIDVLNQALVEASAGLVKKVVEFLPEIASAVIVLILGWVVGIIIARVIEQVVKSLRLDRLLEVIGAKDLVKKSGFNLNSGAFLGELVKWLIIIVAAIMAFNILGLRDVNIFLEGVVTGFIPQVITAVLILLIAAVISVFLQKSVIASAKAGGIASANLLGTITKWTIWIFAFLAVLFQLGIAARFIELIFTGFIVSLSLAIGLAFGIGGKEAAKDYVDRLRGEIRNRD
jgi:hypothetical protein